MVVMVGYLQSSVESDTVLMDTSAAAAIDVNGPTERICNSYTTADRVLGQLSLVSDPFDLGFNTTPVDVHHGSCNLTLAQTLAYSVDADDQALLGVSDRVRSFWGPLLLEEPQWQRRVGLSAWASSEVPLELSRTNVSFAEATQLAIDRNFSCFENWESHFKFWKTCQVRHIQGFTNYKMKSMHALMCISDLERYATLYRRATQYALLASLVNGTLNWTSMSDSKPHVVSKPGKYCPKVCKEKGCVACVSQYGWCGGQDEYCKNGGTTCSNCSSHSVVTFEKKFLDFLQALRTRAREPGRTWPCLMPGLSCKDYVCFGIEAPACSDQVICDSDTVSVTKVRRKDLKDCLIEACSLLGYYEILATAVILATYMTFTKGPTWLCNADARKQYMATTTEASTQEELKQLRAGQ